MRFDSVVGDAFGPFKNDELVLGPRFTVVHGLNESGKSSWAAALYASLAGRRRSKGRGSKEDAKFRARHKPWSGTRWQVTARITTDDGTRLAVVQNLAQGTTRILDLETSGALTRGELQIRFGIQPSTGDDIDVGQLFGLTRGTLRATTFVPQAEVLRVVEQADELQQFLQRAASNQSLDITAHQVIDRLRDELSTRVGSPSIGQRPLRAATHRLQVASDRAYQLRAARDELRLAASELAHQSEDERHARTGLTELETLERWAELDALEDRAAKVHAFETGLAELASVPIPAPVELRERVHAARTSYLNLGEAPSAPEGPGVADLERQIAELPEMPTGDTAPDPKVRRLWEQLQQSVSALRSHDAGQAVQDAHDLPDTDSDELRRVAGRLEVARPTWDPAEDEQEGRLRREHEEAELRHAAELRRWNEASATHERLLADCSRVREQYEGRLKDYESKLETHRQATAEREQSERNRAEQRARRRSSSAGGTWQLAAGVVLLLAGIAMLFVEQVTAVVLLVLALALLGWGVVLRRGRTRNDDSVGDPPSVGRPQAPVPPDPPSAPDVTPPGARPGEPLLSPRVEDIEIRRQRWAEQAAAFDSEREELLSDLQARQLPADPDELQTLARAIDEREGARRAAAERRSVVQRLHAEVEAASAQLLEELRARGEDVEGVAGPEGADQRYRRYEQACHERAVVARSAARRTDLQRALTSMQSEEGAYQSMMERRHTTTTTLLTMVGELGHADGHEADAAATVTETWLREQQEAEKAHQRREQLSSLRDQLLEGERLDQLTARAEEMRSTLGARPGTVAPDDLEQSLAAAARHVEEAATRRASTEGRLRTLRAEEEDLAAALEEEARLRQELSSVEELRSTLELAIEQLEAAESEAHRSLAPALEGAMRSRVPLVTEGRYRDVRVRPEDLVVELQERTGAWRNATYLSQGTTEQTYLLLRLALVEHLDTRETMPLVLDDVTVQCDRHRTVALLELLADIARERQVILFSQESGVLEWARQRLDEGAGDLLVPLTRA